MADTVSIRTLQGDTFSCKTLKTGGDPMNGTPATEITATAAQINTLASVTAGAATASKALVVDSDKAITGLGAVTIGAYSLATQGSGVAISSSVTGALRVYGDDAGADSSGTLASVLGRYLLTVDQTAGTTYRGVLGQVYLASGVDLSHASSVLHGVAGHVQEAGDSSFSGNVAVVDALYQSAGNVTVGSGAVLAGVASRLDMASAKTVTATGKVAAFYAAVAGGAADKWAQGLYVPATAADVGIMVGDFASAAAGSGLVLSPTVTAAARFYGDDAGAALTPSGSVADIRTVIGRFLVTANQSAVHARAWGILGQTKVYDALYSEEQIGGVCGRFEAVQSAGTVTLGGYGVTGAVTGIFATSGTTTVDTNHIASAVAAIADIKGTCTQTGVVAGVYVGKYNTAQWSDGTTRASFGYGVYISDATKDIRLSAGTCILSGAGAPSASATKGSVYLRTDGTGTSDRLYVNTDGGTTWTAVTTAA